MKTALLSVQASSHWVEVGIFCIHKPHAVGCARCNDFFFVLVAWNSRRESLWTKASTNGTFFTVPWRGLIVVCWCQWHFFNLHHIKWSTLHQFVKDGSMFLQVATLVRNPIGYTLFYDMFILFYAILIYFFLFLFSLHVKLSQPFFFRWRDPNFQDPGLKPFQRSWSPTFATRWLSRDDMFFEGSDDWNICLKKPFWVIEGGRFCRKIWCSLHIFHTSRGHKIGGRKVA